MIKDRDICLAKVWRRCRADTESMIKVAGFEVDDFWSRELNDDLAAGALAFIEENPKENNSIVISIIQGVFDAPKTGSDEMSVVA